MLGQRRKTDPSYPPDGEPRDSFPLPPELTQRILFFASEPTITYDRRERTFKYAGLRDLGHPPTDIQNARLVCKTFAELGAPFLFTRLWVSADYTQLAHVKHVAQHPHLSKAVRHLVYDSNTFTDDSADRGMPEKYRHIPKRLFHDQEEILLGELDTQCLLTALPSLTAVTKATCKMYSQHLYSQVPGLRSPDRKSHWPNAEESSTYDHRPLYNLLTALTTTPHNIRTLDLTFHIHLLRDAASDPTRFSTFLAALAPITNLNLAVVTPPPEPNYIDDDFDYADASTTSTASYKAVLRTGALGRLVSAARSLHRFKLSLSPDGQRRSGHSPWRFDAPLSAYVGDAAADATVWAGLRYLYLGCVDARADELAAFVAARRATLACVEFDRCALTRGQWAAVGAVVELGCARWRWMKQNNLTQVEPKARTVAVLPEVVESARAEGREDVPVEVEADRIYFEAKDEMSTIMSGWDEE